MITVLKNTGHLYRQSQIKEEEPVFYASVQHVKMHMQLMVQCKECQMWCMVFQSTSGILASDSVFRDFWMSSYTYTCGNTLAKLDLHG